MDKSMNIEVQATIDDAISKLETLLSSIQDFPETIISQIDILINGSEEITSTEEALNEIDGTSAIADVDINTDEAQAAAESVNDKLNEIDGNVTEAEVDLTDNASPEIDQIEDKLNGLDSIVVNPTVEIDGLGELNDEINTTNENSSNAVGAVTSLASAIAIANTESSRMSEDNSLKKALMFEGIERTPETLSNIKEQLNGVVGAMPREEAAAGMMTLAKTTRDQAEFNALLAPTFTLVKTTSSDMEGAIISLNSAFKLYNLSTSEAVVMTQYMNGALLNLQTSSPDEFMQSVYAATKSLAPLGYEMDEVIDIMGAFDNSGIGASQAASGLAMSVKSLIRQIDPFDGKVNDVEKAIGKMGIAMVDSNGKLRDKQDIMNDLIEAFGGLTDAEFEAAYGMDKATAAQEIFGARGATIWANLKEKPSEFSDEVSKTGDKYVEDTGNINKETRDFAKEFTFYWNQIIGQVPTWAIKLAGFAAGIAVLATAGKFVVGSLIDIGSAFKKLGEKILDVTNLRGKFDDFIKSIKDAFSKLFKTGIKVDEDGVIDLVKVDDGALQAQKSKLSNFINDIKTRVKSLKDSNIWKMIFGDEKGSVNTSFMDDLAKNIENGLNKVKDAIKAPFSGDDADTLLKRQLMGLDEVFDDEAGRVTTSSDNLSNSIRNGLNKIKGSLKVDFKLELPKLNISSSIDDAVNSLKTSITGKLPSVESVGSKLPEALGKGVSKGLKALTISMGAEIAGWGAGLAIQVIDSLANMRDVLADPFKYLGMGQQNLSPVGGFFSKDSMFSQMLPEQLRGILSPKNILKWLVGDEKYGKFEDALKKYVEDPMKKALDDTFKDPLSLFKPITDKFKNINIISLLMPGLGSSNGKDNPVDKFINDLKSKIGGFIPWLQSLKFPNIIDLIFGNNKKEGGKDKANPLDTFVNDIKTKLGGFKAWITTNIPKVPPINWKPLSQGLQDIWTWVTKKYNDLKNFIRNNTPKIPTLPWGNLSKGVRETIKSIQDKWNELKNFLKDLGPKMKDYGRKILQGLVDGLKEKLGPFKDIMKYISDHFPKSPPKIGPLSEVTPQGMADYGNLLGHGLTDGLGGATNNLFGTMGGATGALYNAPTSAAAITNNNDSGITIENVEVSVPESVGSKEEAYLYGQSAGSGFVDTLKNEVSGAGILYR